MGGLKAPSSMGIHSGDKKVIPKGAARISQDTFDEAVRENMDDLEMDEEEAVADAIAQFEAQGIDLSSVLKAAPSAERDAHPIVRGLAVIASATAAGVEQVRELEYGAGAAKSTMKLKFHAFVFGGEAGGEAGGAADGAADDDVVPDPPTEAAVVDALRAVREACEQPGEDGTSARALLGARDGVDLLSSAALSLLPTPSALPHALLALAAAVADAENRERIGVRGLVAVRACIAEHPDDAAVQAAALRAATAAMVQHEQNRATLGEQGGLVATAVRTLEAHADSTDTSLAACAALRALTLQDDARVALNKGFERARAAADAGALPLLAALLRRFSAEGDAPAAASVLLTCSRLACSNKICEKLVNLGVLEECVQLLRAHLQDVPLLRPAAALLAALAGNDAVKQRLCDARAPELCAALLGGHTDSPPALESCTGFLAMLTTRHTDNCIAFVDAGGVEALMGAMRAAPAHVGFIKKGCLAVRNLAVRHPPSIKQLLEHGGEAVLRDAMGRSAELHDEAKAALRDMHCDVTLAQPWKGMPGEEHILERGDANGEDRFAQYLDTDEARAAMRAAGFDTSQMC